MDRTGDTQGGVLEIRLLGAPLLRYGGEEVTHRLRCRRALELLAFLAVGRDRPHGRPELARMFWPNADPAAARANLRQVVLELRRLFEATVGGDVLHASRTELALLPRPGLCLDLPPFEDGCPADEDAVAWFDALWRGPLLDMPLASADKGPFARWLGAQRQEQRAHAGRVLEARAECLEAHGRLTAAVDAARRLLQLNPLDETNHHWIMRLLAEDGSPGRALRHYERYRRRLATEAGDEPGSEIQRLARSLAEAPAPAVPAALSEATERRQWRLLTCLCCELIAVTPVADDVDEESLAEGLEQAGRQVVEAIRRRRGLVDARSPDGVIAYFGFPLAGERAVLEAAEAAREIVSTLDGPVRARVGLHSGTFLADFGRGVPDVLGQGPEVARRVRGHADAGGVTLDEPSWEGVREVLAGERLAAADAGTLWRLRPQEAGGPAAGPPAAGGGPDIGPTRTVMRIHAELDALDTGAGVLQAASVLNGTFSRERLAAIAPPGEPLDAVLQRLVERGLLQCDRGWYRFHREGVRDIVYATLTRRRRIALHTAAAHALLEDDDARDREPATIAGHLEAAGDLGFAIRWWHQAGRLAVRGAALEEAVNHFQRALELARGNSLPAALWQELALDAAEGMLLARGDGSPSARRLLRQVLELAETTGDGEARDRALCWLWLADGAGADRSRGNAPSGERALSLVLERAGELAAPPLRWQAQRLLSGRAEPWSRLESAG